MRTNKFFLVFVSISCLFVLISCESLREEPQFIPVPKYYELSESNDVVFATRPEFSPLLDSSYSDFQDTEESLVALLSLYKSWGEEWMAYSFRLEDYIIVIKNYLSEKTVNTET